uniref:Uncharacterized protein n=1 Tax=Setaria viridis TaxID=4556 RepID=A0A4U6TQG9_SETVI|nr:hypothetical protein SEVIR_7G053109v2 [Setaria viridis]
MVLFRVMVFIQIQVVLSSESLRVTDWLCLDSCKSESTRDEGSV